MADSDVKPAIVYDITGFDRSQVVELLEGIVNHVGYRNKNFFYYLGISKVDQTDQFCKFFKLKPNPETNQPGNGKMFVFQGCSFGYGRSYDWRLVKELREKYREDICLFAKHLEELFENNTKIVEYPFVTSEVYILWLFEIARRRVKDSKNSTDKKKQLDALKIDEAITNLITLMRKNSCKFQDIFLKEGKFHCFSGEVEDREKAIVEIEKKVMKGITEDVENLSMSGTKTSTVNKAPKKTR